MQNTDKDKDNTDKDKIGKGKHKNLISADMRSPEERRRLGSIGGKKAQEINAKRRTAQEVMRMYLECKISKAQATEKLGEYAEYLPDNATLFDVITLKQILESQEGSSKAFEVVRDTAGYKPVDQVQTDIKIMSDQDKALLEKVAKRTGVNPDQG